MTPMVAIAPPSIPPCEVPIKVAMLIAMGPGVDSAMPIKSSSWASLSQSLARTVSFIIAIIP